VLEGQLDGQNGRAGVLCFHVLLIDIIVGQSTSTELMSGEDSTLYVEGTAASLQRLLPFAALFRLVLNDRVMKRGPTFDIIKREPQSREGVANPGPMTWKS
jgi:hypothetical protein